MHADRKGLVPAGHAGAADACASHERTADERAADKRSSHGLAADERTADERAADKRAAYGRAAHERAADAGADPGDARSGADTEARGGRVLRQGEGAGVRECGTGVPGPGHEVGRQLHLQVPAAGDGDKRGRRRQGVPVRRVQGARDDVHGAGPDVQGHRQAEDADVGVRVHPAAVPGPGRIGGPAEASGVQGPAR